MLALTMTEGEYVMIGNNVKIALDKMGKEGRIVVAVDAPKDVHVLRGKNYEAELERLIAEGNTAAVELREKLHQVWLAYLRRQAEFQNRGNFKCST